MKTDEREGKEERIIRKRIERRRRTEKRGEEEDE